MQCSWETCEHHEHVLNEFEHLCIRVWPHSWMQSVNAITLFTECIWFCLDFFVLLFIILWGIWMLECAQYATVAKCVLNCTACVHCVVLYIHMYVSYEQWLQAWGPPVPKLWPPAWGSGDIFTIIWKLLSWEMYMYDILHFGHKIHSFQFSKSTDKLTHHTCVRNYCTVCYPKLHYYNKQTLWIYWLTGHIQYMYYSQSYLWRTNIRWSRSAIQGPRLPSNSWSEK